MNNIVQDIERLNLLECAQNFGFAKGAEVFFLFKLENLRSNQYYSRRNLEFEVVDDLRICSKSTFDKTYALLNKIRHKLMSGEMKSKLELFTNPNEMENHDVTTF